MKNLENPWFLVPSSRLPFPCKGIKIRARDRMNVFAYCEIILRCFISKGSSLEIPLFFFLVWSPLLVVGYCREIKCCAFHRGEVKKRKKREMSEVDGFYPAT